VNAAVRGRPLRPRESAFGARLRASSASRRRPRPAPRGPPAMPAFSGPCGTHVRTAPGPAGRARAPLRLVAACRARARPPPASATCARRPSLIRRRAGSARCPPRHARPAAAAPARRRGAAPPAHGRPAPPGDPFMVQDPKQRRAACAGARVGSRGTFGEAAQGLPRPLPQLFKTNREELAEYVEQVRRPREASVLAER